MELPKRKQSRLLQYDDSRPGCYFITVCTKGKGVPIIIEQMKRAAAKKAGIVIWQKECRGHIIPADAGYLRVWDYIHTNPARWREDCYFTKTEG